MSDLGPIQYEEDTSNPFLGRDYAKSSHSNQIGHEIDLEVRKIMLEAEKKATEIILANRELLELIKTALLNKETIVAEEIEYIEKNMKLPPEEIVEQKKEDKEEIDLDKMLDEISDESKQPTTKNVSEVEKEFEESIIKPLDKQVKSESTTPNQEETKLKKSTKTSKKAKTE